MENPYLIYHFKAGAFFAVIPKSSCTVPHEIGIPNKTNEQRFLICYEYFDVTLKNLLQQKGAIHSMWEIKNF